jgi:hypothetical protein
MSDLKGLIPMSAFRYGVAIFAAVSLGFLFGAYVYHPSVIHAQSASGIRIEKVTEGYNAVIGSQVVAFSCTQEDCFIAVRP